MGLRTGPLCFLSSTTPNAMLNLRLKSRMGQSVSASDKCEVSNPWLKRNDSGLYTESSRIFFEADATRCSQSTTGCCEPIPYWFGMR